MISINYKKSIHKLAMVGVTAISLEFISHVKLSYIFGSYASFFSLTNIGVPMVGLFAGSFLSLISMVARSCIRWGVLGVHPLTFIVYHIPNVCASAYWRAGSFMVKIGFPLLCIGLFIAHPVGRLAFLYSFFWFIPVVIQLIDSRSIFLQALSATFVAHAVGSVLWLYTIPMDVTMWHALIPIVPVERVTFALGMTAIYYAHQRLNSKESCSALVVQEN